MTVIVRSGDERFADYPRSEGLATALTEAYLDPAKVEVTFLDLEQHADETRQGVCDRWAAADPGDRPHVVATTVYDWAWADFMECLSRAGILFVGNNDGLGPNFPAAGDGLWVSPDEPTVDAAARALADAVGSSDWLDQGAGIKTVGVFTGHADYVRIIDEVMRPTLARYGHDIDVVYDGQLFTEMDLSRVTHLLTLDSPAFVVAWQRQQPAAATTPRLALTSWAWPAQSALVVLSEAQAADSLLVSWAPHRDRGVFELSEPACQDTWGPETVDPDRPYAVAIAVRMCGAFRAIGDITTSAGSPDVSAMLAAARQLQPSVGYVSSTAGHVTGRYDALGYTADCHCYDELISRGTFGQDQGRPGP